MANELSDVWCHLSLLPNDLDAMSAIRLHDPATCRGVRGQHMFIFSLRVSARISCSPTHDHLEASRATQLTVGANHFDHQPQDEESCHLQITICDGTSWIFVCVKCVLYLRWPLSAEHGGL